MRLVSGRIITYIYSSLVIRPRQQIMAALNAQTAVQFQQYAAQQYPNNPEQQLGLIRQLQEQHYQQYMQQLYQVQLAQQQVQENEPLQVEVFQNVTHDPSHHLCRIFFNNVFLQAALQKQHQADLVGQGTLDSSSFNNGEQVTASAAGRLCAGSTPEGEEAPTVNGGQSDSYSESMDREQEPELAEEVSENGPLLG